jgi:F420-0:gamma-glutamyl ligase-like protein
MWNPSILGILISLIVLSLVWGTVIAGLILIVRETIEEDDLARFR